VAVSPPVDVAPVLLSLLLQDQTQKATPDIKTSGPTQFFNMRPFTQTEVSRACGKMLFLEIMNIIAMFSSC
jgi:hypothetical protein